ncbi:hypothetical protein [Mesorhizobium huakuii]|uniref:Uncharacterized protein n=1 Tax=Mesorhizobium huakuii TaxID=28104 RepID=A0ABZ0VTL6_9HYPH|nr:hypothetical protein [Mesorhizobium huakuii]WQB98896.1 hypothetical protein U0R22_003062 [Mesorhizobium huakuii]
MLAGMNGVGAPVALLHLSGCQKDAAALLICAHDLRENPDVRGTHQPDEADILPVARLIIVFVMLGSFALVFAELVRQSESMSMRPLPTASRCGDATGMPCPQRAL